VVEDEVEEKGRRRMNRRRRRNCKMGEAVIVNTNFQCAQIYYLY